MKTLTRSEIERVQAYLRTHGLTHEEVLEDVLDHIACELETLMESGLDFESAFSQAQELFSPEEVKNIQSDTLYFLTIKNTRIMIKGIFISAYLSVALFAIGIGFGFFFEQALGDPLTGNLLAGLCKFMGAAVFSFGFLPLFFLYGYKRFMKQIVA